MPTEGTQPLTPDDVAEVAALALLELTKEELEEYAEQLSAVLVHAKDIEALDLSGVAATHHPYPLVNVFRNDTPSTEPSITEAALAAAPEAEDAQFRVPPALGEEP